MLRAEEEEELGEEQTRGEEVVEGNCGEEDNSRGFDGEDCGMEMICGWTDNEDNARVFEGNGGEENNGFAFNGISGGEPFLERPLQKQGGVTL